MNYTKENEITEEGIHELEVYVSTRTSRGDKRLPSILRYRLEGKSLKEIANIFGVTRERIRQQKAKAVEIIKHNFNHA